MPPLLLRAEEDEGAAVAYTNVYIRHQLRIQITHHAEHSQIKHQL